MKPEVGLHKATEFSLYLAWEAVSRSDVSNFERSSAHGRLAMTRPSAATSAMKLGTATHAAILEPETFEAGWVAAPKVDRRTKVGRETWAKFEAANATREVLRAEEFAQVEGMRDAVQAHPIAKQLLAAPGAVELSFVWERNVEGAGTILCKGRADRFTVFDGSPVIVDVKTTEDASPTADGFVRSCAKFGYALQAAWYLDGMAAIAPGERRFLFVAVEKKPPYAVAVHELDQWSLNSGRIQYERLLARYARAMTTDTWEGYPNQVHQIELPVWARRQMEGDEFDDVIY